MTQERLSQPSEKSHIELLWERQDILTAEMHALQKAEAQEEELQRKMSDIDINIRDLFEVGEVDDAAIEALYSEFSSHVDDISQSKYSL